MNQLVSEPHESIVHSSAEPPCAHEWPSPWKRHDCVSLFTMRWRLAPEGSRYLIRFGTHDCQPLASGIRSIVPISSGQPAVAQPFHVAKSSMLCAAFE